MTLQSERAVNSALRIVPLHLGLPRRVGLLRLNGQTRGNDTAGVHLSAAPGSGDIR